MRLTWPLLLVLAACAPKVYHREAERPIARDANAYACAVREVGRMGYELRSPNPGEDFSAARPRPQAAGARYPVYDYLVVEVLDGSPRMLRVGAVTLAGGDGGVSPHFRAPLAQTEADRDAVLAACGSAGDRDQGIAGSTVHARGVTGGRGGSLWMRTFLR